MKHRISFFILMVFAVVAFAEPTIVWLRPNPKLTPGKANQNLTKEIVCSPAFNTEDYRAVSVSKKKHVFKLYGIPWEQHGKYEVDHLIPLELGGSNDIANLWPEAYEPKPGAREKDVIENQLHRLVCEERMPLGRAQRLIIMDWVERYRATHEN